MNTPKIDFDKFICSWLRMRIAVKSDVECGLVIEALGEQGLSVNTSNPQEYTIVELPEDKDVVDLPDDNETEEAEVFFEKGKFYTLVREIPLENYMKGRVYFADKDNSIIDDGFVSNYWNPAVAKSFFRLATEKEKLTFNLNKFEMNLFEKLYSEMGLDFDKCLNFVKTYGKEFLNEAIATDKTGN